MLAQSISIVGRSFWRSLSAFAGKLRILDAREERGLTLLREWLSPEQRAQLEANKHFDAIGCQTGKRYRISYGSGTNVHEIDEAGRPITGWCFVPSGHLVAGDVMLAQKIALETDERGALAVANRFPAAAPRGTNASASLRRAY
jgi:hypothetical protein